VCTDRTRWDIAEGVGQKGLMISSKDGILRVKCHMNEADDVGTKGRGQRRGCREIVATGKGIPR
jgi:hypothetical protein